MASNRIFINKYGFIETVLNGDQKGQKIVDLFVRFEDLCQLQRAAGNPVLFLCNFHHIGNHDKAARQVAIAAIRTCDFDLVAAYGASDHIRQIMYLIFRLSGVSSKIRHFASRQEAVRWLQASAPLPTDMS